jgi:hypothetical protein
MPVNDISSANNIEHQIRSRELLLSDLSADLIFEVEENLHDLMQRALQILDDLKLALDILAFSHYQYTASKDCNTSHLHN